MTDVPETKPSEDRPGPLAPDKRGPHDYPRHWIADVLASDGGVVHLRPIVPEDADGLVRFHSELSERTRYLRYFGPFPHIPPRELARMTTVDHYSRVAFVGVLGGEIIAIGIYEGLAADGKVGTAEVAFVVADAHQGRGLGPILLEHLAGAAAECGFEKFEAEVLAENPNMVAVFRDAGYQLRRSFDGSTIHVEFTIDPTEALLSVRNARERGSEARSVANLLRPTSVAVIGASVDRLKVGNAVLANVIAGGFTGPVFPVNSEHRAVRGIRAYSTVRDIPDPVDLAIVAVPADAVEEVLDDCLHKGVKTMVVLSAGFGETSDSGLESERRLVESIREHGMRLVGPNALGVANTDPSIALNATLAPHVPGRGAVGFFCQSGALGIAILDTAARRQLGLSTFVSAGNRADVSGNDLLQYWDTDPDTEVVLLYLESFGNPRKFTRLARRVSSGKPVVAVKSGRGAVPPAMAAADHSLDDESTRALLAQAGVIQVGTIAQLFDCATVFAYQPLPKGPRVSIVGNSTALGVLAQQAGSHFGLEVVQRVDLGPSAPPEAFEEAVRTAAAADGVDSLIAVFVPPVAVSVDRYAQALMAGMAGSDKPVVTTFLAVEGIPQNLTVTGPYGTPARGSIPSFPGPERAAEALGHAWQYAQWRSRPSSQVRRPDDVDPDTARRLVREAVTASSEAITELDDERTVAILNCYGIHIVPFREVSAVEESVSAANELGYPVAVKAFSESWRGRADREGVRLDLPDQHAVELAVVELAEVTGELRLHVQKMAPKGISTVIRVRDDPSFGSLMSFGLAGVTSDLLGDRAYRALPLTENDAADLIEAPRSAPLLSGYRGQEPVDKAALIDLVTRISALVDDIPEAREVICDPIHATPGGVAVLAARMRVGSVSAKHDSGPRRLG